MKKILIILGLSANAVFAQTHTVTVVKDINTTGGSGISSFTQLNNIGVFSANDGENGNELWVTDGTTAGTQLLKNIYTGTTSSVPNSSGSANFNKLGTKTIFTANNQSGVGLWVTDGSTIGTINLYQFGVGAVIGEFKLHNGKYYFQADNGTNGLELWVTDGTIIGTSMVNDLNPGVDGSFPAHLCSHTDGFLYFSATNSNLDFELWRTDGTTTTLVKDIIPGTTGSYPANMFSWNGLIYFAGYDLTNMLQLWVTDGTSTGTNQFKVINTSGNSFPSQFINFGSKLIFQADNGITGNELWVTDGTAIGTQLLKNINNSNTSSNPQNFFEINNLLYFSSNDGVTGNELWVTDGTTAGTQLKFDINTGTDPSNVGAYFFDGSNLFFSAEKSSKRNLFVTDLTQQPVIYSNINGSLSSNPSTIFKIGTDLFVVATTSTYDQELYKLIPIITYTNPVANNDLISATQGTISTGNLGTNDTGSDAANNPTITVTQLSSTTGTISLDATTGSFTFSPNSTFSGTTTTTYTLCNASGNCSTATITITINNGSSIGINEIENTKVRIYPNPTENKLNVILDDLKAFDYEVYNSLGGVVKKGNSEALIDLTELNIGVYFIKIGGIINKIIKQ